MPATRSFLRRAASALVALVLTTIAATTIALAQDASVQTGASDPVGKPFALVWVLLVGGGILAIVGAYMAMGAVSKTPARR